MRMAEWIRVAALSSCPEGAAAELVVGQRIIALFNVEGHIYALDGICPHQGGPLGKGRIDGHIVTCPWHGWQFDIRTGRHQASDAFCHTTLDVKVEKGNVFVLLDQDGPDCAP